MIASSYSERLVFFLVVLTIIFIFLNVAIVIFAYYQPLLGCSPLTTVSLPRFNPHDITRSHVSSTLLLSIQAIILESCLLIDLI